MVIIFFSVPPEIETNKFSSDAILAFIVNGIEFVQLFSLVTFKFEDTSISVEDVSDVTELLIFTIFDILLLSEKNLSLLAIIPFR
ncbi:hypothetical protein D3C76_1042530 [compost metagenome]